MHTIAMTNYKGGSGKSSAAIHLSVAAACRGLRTVLIDTDVQGSASQWAGRRTVDNLDMLVVSSGADRLKDCMASFADRADLCVVDTPGHDWTAMSWAAVAADLSLVVARPTQLDLETALKVGAAYRELGLPYAILITQAAPRISAKSEVWAEAYGNQSAVVSQRLTHRAAFQDSIVMGLGVKEYEPNGRAAAEIETVLGWILGYFTEQR